MDGSYDKRFSELINGEINQALEKGALRVSILTILSSFALFLVDFLGIVKYLLVPAIWAFTCGLFAFFLHYCGKKRLISDKNKYYLLFPFVSLPMGIYIICYFFLPSGTATYITGPPSYIFILVLIMTGFLFEKNISLWAGIIVATEYMLVYFLGKGHLQSIRCGDPILYQNLTSFISYLFKSLIFLFCGVAIGVLTNHAKELVEKILSEETQRLAIDHLFGQFVSREVKDKLIAEKKDKIAEKKNVAVLFSDIRSFTTMSEKITPDQVVHFLNQYLDKAVKSIDRNGGVIDKFVGDAIMATFGGLQDLENPCRSAVDAARDLLKDVNNFNEERKKEGSDEIMIGVGIHYGEVLQGTIGSSDRKEFTVIGDSVNTASRIESLCKTFSLPIILSQEVFAALPEDYKKDAVDLGEAEVKGKQQKVRVYGLSA